MSGPMSDPRRDDPVSQACEIKYVERWCSCTERKTYVVPADEWMLWSPPECDCCPF